MKDTIFSLSLIFTLILGVWNIINNYRLARRTAFINTVTVERIKWIEKLRDNISTFCGLTHTWRSSELEGKSDELEILKQLDKLRYLIRLQLNPIGNHDREIESLIAEIPDLTHETQIDRLKGKINDLIVVSQKLLKDEWDKVKEEVQTWRSQGRRSLSRPVAPQAQRPLSSRNIAVGLNERRFIGGIWLASLNSDRSHNLCCQQSCSLSHSSIASNSSCSA